MPRNNENEHHTLWVKRHYMRAGREPNRLRGHFAMRHMMEIPQHNELHANINPLPVMSRGLAITALDFLPKVSHKGKFESFTAIIEHFAVLSQRTGRQAIESGRFAEHLEEQYRYMTEDI